MDFGTDNYSAPSQIKLSNLGEILVSQNPTPYSLLPTPSYKLAIYSQAIRKRFNYLVSQQDIDYKFCG